jgi:hypothetical protein
MTETGPTADRWLLSLVELTENGTLSGFDIIVMVGGQTLTGRIVREVDWHRSFAASAEPGGASANALTIFADRAEKARQEVPAGAQNEEYVHLSNVRILQASGLTNGFMTFRVRISDISAWSYGRLG